MPCLIYRLAKPPGFLHTAAQERANKSRTAKKTLQDDRLRNRPVEKDTGEVKCRTLAPNAAL
jgi:hypothetical protein